MTVKSEKSEIRTESVGAIDKLGAAIELALAEAPVSDVLSILTGAFVGLTLELVRREGHDVSKEIRVDGGRQRDITIHTPKEQSDG
jgi:cob(I)alamin adenosyltransferase